VPQHLRDAHYPAAKGLGHGEGYVYPHDAPGGWVPQTYRPPEVAGRVYYEPTGRGADVAREPGSAVTDQPTRDEADERG
jgi:putative ATPase